MAKFFIDRPIFAAVISVVITLAGGIAVITLAACGADSNKVTPSATVAPPATAAVSGSPTSAAIAISVPAEGASVAVPFDISGSADVFEAVLVVSVSDASGTLCERSTFLQSSMHILYS